MSVGCVCVRSSVEVLDNVEAWPLADIDVGRVPTELRDEPQHIRLGLHLTHQVPSRP